MYTQTCQKCIKNPMWKKIPLYGWVIVLLQHNENSWNTLWLMTFLCVVCPFKAQATRTIQASHILGKVLLYMWSYAIQCHFFKTKCYCFVATSVIILVKYIVNKGSPYSGNSLHRTIDSVFAWATAEINVFSPLFNVAR